MWRIISTYIIKFVNPDHYWLFFCIKSSKYHHVCDLFSPRVLFCACTPIPDYGLNTFSWKVKDKQNGAHNEQNQISICSYRILQHRSSSKFIPGHTLYIPEGQDFYCELPWNRHGAFKSVCSIAKKQELVHTSWIEKEQTAEICSITKI